MQYVLSEVASSDTPFGNPLADYDPTNPKHVSSYRQATRQENARRKREQNKNSSLRGVRHCGQSLIQQIVAVHLNLTHSSNGKSKSASFSGQQRCKSKACITCCIAAQYDNKTQLELYMEAALLAGNMLAYGTLTSQSKRVKTPPHYSQEVAFERSKSFTLYTNPADGSAKTKARLKAELEKWVEQNSRPNSWERWYLYKQIKASVKAAKSIFGSNFAFTQDKKLFGIVAYVYVFEIRVTPDEITSVDPITKVETITRDWNWTKTNFHMHFMVEFDRRIPITEEDRKGAQESLEAYADRIFPRWVKLLAKEGVKALEGVQQIEWIAAHDPATVAKISSYLTKTAYALAAPNQAMKEHEDGTRSFTHWQALDDSIIGIDDNGMPTPMNYSALNYFRNWEGAQKNNYSLINWSKTARSRYGIIDEVAAARAEKRLQETVERILTLTTDAWYALLRSGDSRVLLLNIVENSDSPRIDAAAFLTERGFVEGKDFYVSEEEGEIVSELTAAEKELYSSLSLPF
jgi:hypothetical protein